MSLYIKAFLGSGWPPLGMRGNIDLPLKSQMFKKLVLLKLLKCGCFLISVLVLQNKMHTQLLFAFLGQQRKKKREKDRSIDA